jgi:hypothetical protein
MSTNNTSSPTSQPSSILFFIAVAIGVVIAMVFIFFSLRYYVRTKLGIYATARLSASPNNGGLILVNSDLPLQPFPMNNHDLYHHIQSQRRRRRRYLKKRRLTEEEVNHLFPVRTYQDWLDGGAERDIHTRDIAAQLKEEHDEALVADEQDETREGTPDQAIEMNQTNTDEENGGTHDETTIAQGVNNTPNSSDERQEVDLGNPFHEIHFDSGSCAICIDTFEPQDQVRGLICGHVFHQECLDPWLIKRKACCPMCKRDYYLKNNEEDEESENADAQDNESLAFPELQYRTLPERVQDILQRNPELEEVAKNSIKHYLGWKWRIFWMLMGISRQDLVNCAIISEDERLRRDATNTASQEPNGDADTNERPRDVEAERERVERMV